MSSKDLKLWARMVWALIAPAVKGMVAKALDDIDETDVAHAKKDLKTIIQSKHAVPGEIRKWLCKGVDSITATTVEGFKAKIMRWVNGL